MFVQSLVQRLKEEQQPWLHSTENKIRSYEMELRLLDKKKCFLNRLKIDMDKLM